MVCVRVPVLYWRMALVRRARGTFRHSVLLQQTLQRAVWLPWMGRILLLNKDWQCLVPSSLGATVTGALVICRGM